MGPYQMSDLGGRATSAGRRASARPRPRDPPCSLRAHRRPRSSERGWFATETGRGYYLYSRGSRAFGTPPDPEVEATIDADEREADITPRSFRAEEIIRRYMAAMINEGANVVPRASRCARSTSDRSRCSPRTASRATAADR
jgi:3-hydroxyacyl-CoA dehydrogenase